MSLVSSRLSLIHRCTILRDANSARDSWGNAAAPDWQPHLVDVPCRSWVDAGREAVTDTTTVVVIQDVRVALPLGTDVTERDQVGSVTYRGGKIQEGPLQVRAVLVRRDRIELILAMVA